MNILDVLKEIISDTGIKEVARRSGLSPSTVSRIRSGQINPSFDVVNKISEAVGFQLHLKNKEKKPIELKYAKEVLLKLKEELTSLGVSHVTLFGSVARGTQVSGSDIDVYLDCSNKKIPIADLLKAEGQIIEAFDGVQVDIVTQLKLPKNEKLKQQIEQEGVSVF